MKAICLAQSAVLNTATDRHHVLVKENIAPNTDQVTALLLINGSVVETRLFPQRAIARKVVPGITDT